VAYKIQTMSSNRFVKVYSDTFCRRRHRRQSHTHRMLDGCTTEGASR